METNLLTPPRSHFKQITQTSLEVIDTIYRYRFIQSSQLFRLVRGHWRNVYRHLKALSEHYGLIKRLPMFDPETGKTEDAVYYLASTRPLELLSEYGLRDPEELDERRLPSIDSEAGEGRRLFIRHELMISRLHAMLDLACKQSAGEVELVAFRQGAELNSYAQAQALPPGEGMEEIPVRPDAFFTLYFPNRAEGKQYESFVYEADRKTMDTTRMIKKLRGLFYFIVKEKKHQGPPYNISSIRAVLIETVDTKWAETLRQASAHPAVSGPKPSNLFWFTSSEFFTKPLELQQYNRLKIIPTYLEHPELIFNPVWFSPNDQAGSSPRSILDP